MAIFFMDSLAHYTTAAQGATKIASSGTAPVAATGAFGNPGRRPVDTADADTIDFVSKTTLEVSFHAILTAQFGRFVEFWTTLGRQATLEVHGDGTFKFCRGGDSIVGSGTVLGSSAAAAITFNVQHHFYLKNVSSQTVGTFDLAIDGVSVLSLTGLDNCLQVAADMTQFRMFGSGSSNIANAIFSHLALADASGNITGQPRVEALFPDGAGNYSQWVPTAGANYTNVDETTPNDDTDYVAESTLNDRDSYTYSNMLGAAATILAVALVPRIRKDDAVARTVKRFVRAGGTDYDGAAVAVPASYGYLQEILVTNPATAVAWTPAEVNAIEAGIKVES